MGKAERLADETLKQRGFGPGQRVAIRSVKGHPLKALDGLAGTIAQWLPESECFEVNIPGREPVCVDPVNLALEGDEDTGEPVLLTEGPPPTALMGASKSKDVEPGDMIEVFRDGVWHDAQVLQGRAPRGHILAVQLDVGQEVHAKRAHIRVKDNCQVRARRQLANDMARQLLTQRRRLTQEDVLSVLKVWPFQPNASRQKVLPFGANWVYSDTFGLVHTRGSDPCAVSHLAMHFPDIMKLLARWMRDTVPKLFRDFCFTSVNLNYDYAARLHRDGRNAGPSLTRSFGHFEGGALRYFAEDDHSWPLERLAECQSMAEVLDTKSRWHLIDGDRAHSVEATSGQRYSVVFFSILAYGSATREQRRTIRRAGGIWPTKASIGHFQRMLPEPRGYPDRKRRRSVDERSASCTPSRRRRRSGSVCEEKESESRDADGEKRHAASSQGCATAKGDDKSTGSAATNCDAKVTDKRFKVLQFPHLNLKLDVGATYTHSRLVKRCRGDRLKIAALRRKLQDPLTFEPV